jgi:hypothetical protein
MERAMVEMGGELEIAANRVQMAPLAWRIRNALRPAYLGGLLANLAAKLFSWLTGIPTLSAELRILLRRRDGTLIDYGVVGYRVVSSAFVAFVVDQLQAESSLFGDYKFHGSGTGTTNEASSDTALEAPDGQGRVTGSQTEGEPNEYRSVGTIFYSTTLSIAEHGLFNDVSAGTLMDRTVFTALDVTDGDALTYAYTMTISAGG